MKKTTNTSSKASKAAKETVAAKAATATATKNESHETVENYFEIDGEQVKVEDIVEKIRKENKGLKTLQTYFNFTERRCYYVADGKAEGKFVEF